MVLKLVFLLSVYNWHLTDPTMARINHLKYVCIIELEFSQLRCLVVWWLVMVMVWPDPDLTCCLRVCWRWSAGHNQVGLQGGQCWTRNMKSFAHISLLLLITHRGWLAQTTGSSVTKDFLFQDQVMLSLIPTAWRWTPQRRSSSPRLVTWALIVTGWRILSEHWRNTQNRLGLIWTVTMWPLEKSQQMPIRTIRSSKLNDDADPDMR